MLKILKVILLLLLAPFVIPVGIIVALIIFIDNIEGQPLYIMKHANIINKGKTHHVV